MSRGRCFEMTVLGLAVAALAVILLFPALIATVISVRDWLGEAAITAGGDFTFSSWLGAVICTSDAGAQSALGSNLLCSFVFLAGVSIMVLPLRWPSQLNRLYLGGAACLALLAISAYFSTCPHDAFLLWGKYSAVFVCFVVSSLLAYRFYRPELLRWVASAQFVLALIVVIWAWISFAFTGDNAVAMYGHFYNQNVMSAWLLLIWPTAFLLLGEPTDPKDSWTIRMLRIVLVASLSVSIYYGYNRSAWAVLAFIALLSVALSRSCSAKGHLLGASEAALSVLASIAAVVCGLRGLYLPAIAGACLALGLTYALLRQSKYAAPKQLLANLAFCLAVGLVLVACLGGSSLGAEHASVRLHQLAGGADTSAAARVEFYRAAWLMSLDHPLLGVGPDGFDLFYPSYQRDFRWFSKHSHCFFLDILCECGWPAFLLLLALLGYGAMLLYRRWKEDEAPEKPWRLGLSLGVLALLIHSQADIEMNFLVLPLTAAMWAGVCLATPTRAECAEPQEEAGEEVVRSSWSIRPSMVRQYAGALFCMVLLGLNAKLASGMYYATFGQYFADHGREELALEYYRDAVNGDPWSGDNHRHIAALLLNMHMDKRADISLEELEEHSALAQRLDPHRAVACSVRGRALEAQGRWQEALACFRRSLEIDRVNFPSTYANMARMLVNMGKNEEAIACMEYAIKQFPMSAFEDMFSFRVAQTLNELTDLYCYLITLTKPGETRRVRYLDELEILSPESPIVPGVRGEGYLVLAVAAERAGKYEEARQLCAQAERDLRRALEMDSNYHPAKVMLEEVAKLREQIKASVPQ